MLHRLFYCKCLKTIWFSCLLTCCLVVSAKAQYFSLDSSRHQVSMPFRFIRNLVVIQLKINNKGPFNFILDTGVGQILITEPSLVDSINIESKRTIKISGFGEGEDYEAFITTPLHISMKGLASHEVTAAILKKDLFGLSSYAGMRIHGLLGYEFFNKLTVRVDFEDSVITVTRPGRFHGFKNGSKLPISIENNRPYIETNVTCEDGTGKATKLIVDLGAGHAVSLEKVSDKAIFSDKFIPGNLGVGLKGLISGYLGRIKAIDLGKYKIKNLIASFPDDSTTIKLTTPRDGNLGVDLLKKFVLVFDYSNNAIYIKSSSGFNDPFEHDMSGLQYYATGDSYNHVIIERVEAGSPGELAGLEKDDEIMAINFKPVSSMTLEQIDQIFRSRDNRVLFLDIYHDQKFTTLITLKRRI
jgi:predicted aspartyl protease